MDMSAPPPTHDDIARRAHQLWQDRGCPHDRDVQLWLEAERQLSNGGHAAFIERAQSETAAESVVEYQISPALPEREAILAALQKQEARAPQEPHQSAPHARPAETGKPLWPKAHSN